MPFKRNTSAKCSANTAGNQLPLVVQGAMQLAAAGDRLAAATVLEDAAKGSKQASEAAGWLLQAGLWLQRLDPPRAARSLKCALEADQSLTRGWLALALLREKAGHSAAACQAALAVLRLNAPPSQRIDAAGLLMRQGQSHHGLSVAQEAFEELGRPLSQAGILLTAALTAAAWPLAESLMSQLHAAYLADRRPENPFAVVCR